MADLNKTDARLHRLQAGSFGNVSTSHVQRNLNGAVIADVVFFMKLPRGTKVYDSMFFKSGAAATLNATMKLGLQAAGDGTKGDDDFFNAAKALDGAAALHRKDNAAVPLYLDDDDYYVVGTIAGANVGAVDTLADVVVNYEFAGNL